MAIHCLRSNVIEGLRLSLRSTATNYHNLVSTRRDDLSEIQWLIASPPPPGGPRRTQENALDAGVPPLHLWRLSAKTNFVDHGAGCLLPIGCTGTSPSANRGPSEPLHRVPGMGGSPPDRDRVFRLWYKQDEPDEPDSTGSGPRSSSLKIRIISTYSVCSHTPSATTAGDSPVTVGNGAPGATLWNRATGGPLNPPAICMPPATSRHAEAATPDPPTAIPVQRRYRIASSRRVRAGCCPTEYSVLRTRTRYLHSTLASPRPGSPTRQPAARPAEP